MGKKKTVSIKFNIHIVAFMLFDDTFSTNYNPTALRYSQKTLRISISIFKEHC